MEEDEDAEPDFWMGIGIWHCKGWMEEAARSCVSSERADSFHPQHGRKRTMEKVLKERKEGIWFGSLLWQCLQNKVSIVLEEKKIIMPSVSVSAELGCCPGPIGVPALVCAHTQSILERRRISIPIPIPITIPTLILIPTPIPIPIPTAALSGQGDTCVFLG